MTVWLPYAYEALQDGTIDAAQFNWIQLAAAMMPGAAVATIAAKKEAEPFVASASFSLIGGFIFIGPINGWIGGANISLLSLAAGEMGVCKNYGYSTLVILMLVMSTSFYVSFKRILPPGNEKESNCS